MERPNKRFKSSSFSLSPAIVGDGTTTCANNRLAQKALHIVLQHLMIPDLGWNVQHYESLLPSLREELLELQFKGNTRDEDSYEAKKRAKELLETEMGYFDESYFNRLNQEVNHEVTPQILFQQIPSSTADRTSCRVEDIRTVCCGQPFDKYFKTHSLMLQHSMITYTIGIRYEYLQLYCKIVKMFTSYEHSSSTSLVVYQLAAWQLLKERLRLLELLLFSFGFTPLTLAEEGEYHRGCLLGGEEIPSDPECLLTLEEALPYIQQAIVVYKLTFQTPPRHQKIINIASGMFNAIRGLSGYIERCQDKTMKRESQATRKIMTNERMKTIHGLCHQLLLLKDGINYCSWSRMVSYDHMVNVASDETIRLDTLSFKWQIYLLQRLYHDFNSLCDVHDNGVHNLWSYAFDVMEVIHVNMIERYGDTLDPQGMIIADSDLVAMNGIFKVLAMKESTLRYGEERYYTNCVKLRWRAFLNIYIALCTADTYRARLRVASQDHNDDDRTDAEFLELFSKFLMTIHTQVTVYDQQYVLTTTDCGITNNAIDIEYLIASVNCPILEDYSWIMTCDVKKRDDDVLFHAYRCLIFDLIEYYREDNYLYDAIISFVKTSYMIATNVWEFSSRDSNSVFSIRGDVYKMVLSLLVTFRRLMDSLYEDSIPETEAFEIVKDIKKLYLHWMKLLQDNDDLEKLESRRDGQITFPKVLIEVEIQIQRILIWQKRVELLTKEIGDADESANERFKAIKDMIINCLLDTIQSIPLTSISQNIKACHTFANDHHQNSVMIEEKSNIRLLQHYLFWLEKAFDIILICFELTSEIEIISLKIFTLSSTFGAKVLHESIPPLIETVKGMLSLYSIFLDPLCNHKIADSNKVEWLRSVSPVYVPIHDMLTKDQTRVTTELQRIATLWKEECRRYGKEELLPRMINESNQHTTIKAYALFNK